MLIEGNFNLTLDKLSQLPALEHLILSKNELKDFPLIKTLKKLFFWKSGFHELPDSICDLNNLEWLKINESELRKLPNCTPKLKKLEKINVIACKLEEIPENIIFTRRLQNLNLPENNIKDIPKRLRKQQKINLNINNNPVFGRYPYME